MAGGQPHVIERVVDTGDDGARADLVLAAWLDESRGRAQQRLRAGQVLVDGEPAGKSRRLRTGERVVVLEPLEPAAPPPPPAVPVRYEDEHLLVVAKPAGLVVHPGAGRAGSTLVDALIAMGVPLAPAGGGGDSEGGGGSDPRSRDDETRPGIVHRLDRGTSGLLVVAKTTEAYRGLTALLKVHDVVREYWTLVQGVPSPPRATVDAPIARSTTRRTRFVTAAQGRRAVTHYDLVEDLASAAVLAVRLETGRTHQVRVHLSAVGHPVAGDTTYGGDPRLREVLGLERPALHACRLAFRHPVTGESIDVSEALPDDLFEAVRRLKMR